MTSDFIFVICQSGAEAVCKQELLSNHPGLRFAFSRPGFLTFKREQEKLAKRFYLKSTFARTYGWCLGHRRSADLQDQYQFLQQNLAFLTEARKLHIWQRDSDLPGSSGFEPGTTVLAQQAGERVAAESDRQAGRELAVNRIARADEAIIDVVLVEPDDWWCGYHYAGTPMQRYPGGVPPVNSDKPVISRAYYKLWEALLWSGIHIGEGDHCAEIGSSPGGACQLLLEKGADVIAIDPAELDESLADHPNLTYLRCRGREVAKKKLKDVQWLLCDINVAPSFTLDAVEEIVTNQHVNRIRGLILTLKLADWRLAEEIEGWQERIRKLGFKTVKTRQLAFNRREICLVAVRDRFALRESRKGRRAAETEKPRRDRDAPSA